MSEKETFAASPLAILARSLFGSTFTTLTTLPDGERLFLET